MKDKGGKTESSLILRPSSFIPHPSSFSPWPHRVACVLAGATFVLLLIGGLVTSKGAGLAVPDWPTTFGYNMFLYPWSKMIGNVFYEHSHRLAAATVGLLTIALAITLWLQERRQWLRWLGAGAILLIILQGVIGGLRVVWLESTLAIFHAALAQAFFALAVSLAIFTSPEWRHEPAGEFITDGGRLGRLSAATTGLIYVQSVLGAVLRHTGERVDLHLFFAALVALHVALVFARVMRSYAGLRGVTRPATFLGVLLVLQLLLGAAAYLGKFTAMLALSMEALVFLTTMHLLTGALMLAASLLLTLRAYRVSAPAKNAVDQAVLTEQFSG